MNEITITKFLSAFFGKEFETINLITLAAKGTKEKPRYYKTNCEKFSKDKSLHKQLKKDNETKGVYFFVNSGGIKDEQIKKFNAFFIENDELSIEEQHKLLNECPIQPSIRVETKKSVHAYWLIDGDCSESDWRLVQSKLIAFFDSDKSIKNLGRCMRLPFFNHVSYDGTNFNYKKVEIAAFDPESKFTVEEMNKAFTSFEICKEPQAAVKPVTKQVPNWMNSFSSLSEAAIYMQHERSKKRKGYDSEWDDFEPEDAYSSHQNTETRDNVFCDGMVIESRDREESLYKNEKADEVVALSSEFICLDDVEPEEISWLWFPYIALGKLTMISGEEGLGKSWLTCAFASAVSNGYGFPLSDSNFESGNVLMLSAEDGLGDTIKPRLVSCKANTKKIFALNEGIVFDENGLKSLERHVSKLKPKLIMVDPLFAYTSAKTDVNSANQSRAVSSRLTEIAANHNCAIVLIRHIGKSKGMGDSRAAGLGSIDWRAAVRSELLVGKNPNDENEKAIVQTKNNLAKFGDSIGFEIKDSANGAVFQWTGKSDLSAEQILSIPEQRRSGSEMSKAESFLLTALGEGERPASEVMKEAESVGLTEQNLRTARTKLDVKVRKEGNGYTGEQRWFWRLPDDMSLI